MHVLADELEIDYDAASKSYPDQPTA